MLAEALIVTRREIRDSLRDWRIILPIVILALIFPYVMEFASNMAINFSQREGVTSVPFSFIPFALLLVGFFPVSISLVMALESFVGERERNTLEPLLAAPLSDTSLYIGKLLSALIPPLLTSYFGMAVYLLTLYIQTHYTAESTLLLQIILITTAEALVMVAGAVVISSHATSVRAANLLASMVILPVAGFLQVESLLVFWGHANSLWYILALLIVVGVILVRMGVSTFNREAILTREVDELNWRRMLERFRFHLLGGEGFSLRRIYREDLPQLLRANRLPLAVTLVAGIGALAFGAYLAAQYPLPAGAILPAHVPTGFEHSMATPDNVFLPSLDTFSIFTHNVRTLLLAMGLALFTFGTGALFVLIAPLALIGLFTGEVAHAGINPVLFLTAFILPHGIVEIPAAILATTFALRLGAAVMAPPDDGPAGEHFIKALADWVKVFVFLVVPLLLMAAFVEALLTPRLVALVYGG